MKDDLKERIEDKKKEALEKAEAAIYSGQMNLRLSNPETHKKLSIYAIHWGYSLNRFIDLLLEDAIEKLEYDHARE